MSDSNTNPIDQIIDIARGASDVEADDVENRGTRRQEYDAPIAFVQWTPTGGKSISTVVQTKNLSTRGLCVISRYMLHVGHEGVVLMSRSNGDTVLLGVKVIHCEYVGDMMHESGLKFIEAPSNLSMDDFFDEQGNLPDLPVGKAA